MSSDFDLDRQRFGDRLSDDLLRLAQGLSSSSLHEAAGKIGALPASIKPIDRTMRVCGRAYPVRCPAGDNLFLHHAIYEASPGDVLIVDVGVGTEFGYWGDIMTAAAQRRGLAGLVITGGIRDSLQIIDMQFPVFAAAICVRGTRKDPSAPGALGRPVALGETCVMFGDLVFGDADGVVVIPATVATDVVATAILRDLEEEAIAQRLEGGETTLDIYGLPRIATTFTGKTDPLIERLKLLDTCAVSDALDRLHISAALRGIRALTVTRRIVGRAVTVQLGLDDGRPSRQHLCTAAVASAGSGQIIVIAHEGRTGVAGWGGILSLAAARRNIEGVIIDGACRDIDESAELGLPIYGRAGVPITARGRIVELSWNEPVVLCGIRIEPNDLLICDGSGVVAVPRSRAEEVIGSAELIARRERLMAEDVRSGASVAHVMGTSYESMLSREKI